MEIGIYLFIFPYCDVHLSEQVFKQEKCNAELDFVHGDFI